MSDMVRQLADAISESRCEPGPSRALTIAHNVHFYRTEDSLIRTVVDFLANGLRSGQPVIVIATEEHRKAFAAGLRAKGLDPDEPFSGRVVLWLDARAALTAFMEGGRPNKELFLATIGSVFEQLINKRSYLIVRGYGEMVDLLWKEGNSEGAIQLEQLWNDLADRYSFSLLCAYSVENFFLPGGVEGFRRICTHHTHALPLEGSDEHVA